MKGDAVTEMQALLDLVCLGAGAQPETGGDLLLHFGDWIPYEVPPRPDLLTVERGRWSLMISCPWRIDGPHGVICDWASVADSEQQDAQGFLALEGRTVTKLQVDSPGLDLQIVFSDGYRLSALCDSRGSSDDCWYVLRPDDSSIVAKRTFELVIETADDDR
jgi:hypothetical protein